MQLPTEYNVIIGKRGRKEGGRGERKRGREGRREGGEKGSEGGRERGRERGDVFLRRSFTRPSTVLAVIEDLGTKLPHFKVSSQVFC